MTYNEALHSLNLSDEFLTFMLYKDIVDTYPTYPNGTLVQGHYEADMFNIIDKILEGKPRLWTA